MTVGELRQVDQLPPTLTVEEAGQLLGISRRSAYRAVERGEIPSLRLGRLLRVPTVKLLDLIGFGADATIPSTSDHVDGPPSGEGLFHKPDGASPSPTPMEVHAGGPAAMGERPLRDVIRGWCSHCHREFEDARCPNCGRPPGLFALEVSDAPNVYAGRKVYRDLAPTSTEAQQTVARIRQDLERGRRPDDARVQLRMFCEQLWLPIIEATVDVATVLSYRGELERHVWTRSGGWPLAELLHAPMRRWLQRLLDRGRCDGRGGLAPRTVDYIRRLLHRALDLAVDGGYLAHNPCPERTPRPRGGPAPTCGPRVLRPYIWT